jgi:hypothetical protein
VGKPHPRQGSNCGNLATALTPGAGTRSLCRFGFEDDAIEEALGRVNPDRLLPFSEDPTPHGHFQRVRAAFNSSQRLSSDAAWGPGFPLPNT